MKSFKQHTLNEALTSRQAELLRKVFGKAFTYKTARGIYYRRCYNALLDRNATVDNLKSVEVPPGLAASEASLIRAQFFNVLRGDASKGGFRDLFGRLETQPIPESNDMKSFKQHTLSEAFTRQHYVAIAELIDETLERIEETTNGNDKAIDAVAQLGKSLATMFKNDNPNFDKQRFLSACGINH